MGIDIAGAEHLISKIDKLSTLEQITKNMGKACAVVEKSAKKKAPKDTGNLRRSIESRVEPKIGKVQGVVFTPVEYAPYVEYGTGLFAEKDGRQEVPWMYEDEDGNFHKTSGQHPQPFLRPALEENRKRIARILKEGLNG